MSTIGRFVLLVLVGLLLMFGAHLAAFAAYATLAAVIGSDLSLPYWWAYPILYPSRQWLPSAGAGSPV